jgi:mannose-6-phosphate isomerase-like protein (cupin superfamily)
MQLKVAAEEVGDAYTLCFGHTPPGLGPPLHLHEFDDQTHYVTKGTYELICGPDVVVAGEGACVHMPRYTPHTFRNVGDDPAELIEFTIPGGIDRYFDAVAHLGAVAADVDARNEVGRSFGMSFPEHPEAYIEPPEGESRRETTVVGAGEGERLDGFEGEAWLKFSAADTGGTHTVTEIALPAGADVLLPMRGWLAAIGLEGAFALHVGDERAEATVGDTIAVGSVASVRATTDGPARFLVYAAADS